LTNKAQHNAIVTSLLVCCGFVICWSTSRISYFLDPLGVSFDVSHRFFHITMSLVFTTAVWILSYTNSLTLFAGREQSSFWILVNKPHLKYWLLCLAYFSLYQLFCLRHQVPRVSELRQTYDSSSHWKTAISFSRRHSKSDWQMVVFVFETSRSQHTLSLLNNNRHFLRHNHCCSIDAQ